MSRKMDALEFVGRLYSEATRWARSYERSNKTGTFREWLTEFNEHLLEWNKGDDDKGREEDPKCS